MLVSSGKTEQSPVERDSLFCEFVCEEGYLWELRITAKKAVMVYPVNNFVLLLGLFYV